MGGAASSLAPPQTGSVGREKEAVVPNHVQMTHVAKHLRIFRNMESTSGEILVLVDDDIASLNIDGAHNWVEQCSSRLQHEYFEKCGIKLYIPVTSKSVPNNTRLRTPFEYTTITSDFQPSTSLVKSGSSSRFDKEVSSSRKAKGSVGIDEKLDEMIVLLNKTMSDEMSAALCKAMDEYELKVSEHLAVVELCRRIKETNYANVSRSGIEVLKQDINSAHGRLLIQSEKDSTSTAAFSSISLLELVNSLDKMFSRKCRKLNKLLRLADYTFTDVLYRGLLSSVYQAERRDDKSLKYAIKVITKSETAIAKTEERVRMECQIMQRARKYPDYFTSLYQAFATSEHYFLVMAFEPVGDCLSLLTRLQMGIPEDMVVGFIAEVSYAIQFIHERGIVHRDIKLDNILITMKGHAKVMDFGVSVSDKRKAVSSSSSNSISGSSSSSSSSFVLSRSAPTAVSTAAITIPNVTTTNNTSGTNSSGSDKSVWMDKDSKEKGSSESDNSVNIRQSGYLYSYVGNIHYIAPEVLMGIGYDSEIDWWSLGVLTFHCITLKTPFRSGREGDVNMGDNELLHTNILEGKVDWALLPPDISSDCRNFIGRLLCPQSHNRLVGKEVFSHSFLNSQSIGPQMFKEPEGPLMKLVQRDSAIRENEKGSSESKIRQQQALLDYEVFIKDSISHTYIQHYLSDGEGKDVEDDVLFLASEPDGNGESY